jgi:hypothetical protein
MRLKGVSFAEAEQFAEDVLRRHILALPDSDLKQIVQTRIDVWKHQFSSANRTGHPGAD